MELEPSELVELLREQVWQTYLAALRAEKAEAQVNDA